METKNHFSINFGNYCTEIDGDMFYRFKDWAKENKVEFRLTISSYYEDESYENQDDEEVKPKISNYGIHFTSDFPDIFFKNIDFFTWRRK